MSYQATKVSAETRTKQAWQEVPALAIHVQGLSGETMEELQAQLREIILVTGLPVDRDMAQCIFEDWMIKAGSAKTGMKSAANVFSTHTYASCVLPLQKVYLFAANPALSRCVIAEEKIAGTQLGVEYSSNNAGDGPNFSEMIDVSYNPTEYVDADDNRLRIAFWNTNGHMVRDQADAVISFMRHFRVDIMALSDVRLHARAAKIAAGEIRGHIRGASVINMPTTRSTEVRGGGERMNTMGGTMFVVAPRCTSNIIDKKADPSGLGIVGYIKLKINGKKLCVISMYKPIIQQTAGSSTVVYRLRTFLKKNKINKDPSSYVYDLVAHWIATARRDDFTIVLGGDFNADPVLHTSVGNHLRNWATDMRLIDALRIRLPDGYLTHRCNGEDVTSIDHIYVDCEDSDKVTSACVAADPMILAASDHNVIGISFTWPKFSMRAQALNHSDVIRPPRRVELPHYNEDKNTEYAELMQDWFNSQMDDWENTPASEGLYYVMRASVQTTKEITEWKYNLSEHVGFRSSFKGGYSRILCAIKLAHRLILRYRYLFKSAATTGTLRQKGSMLQINFGKAYNKWKELFPAQDMKKCDSSEYEAYQKAAEIMQSIQLERRVALHHLEDASKSLLNMLHGRKRSIYRLNMNDRISKMEMLRQQRRIGQIFTMINLKDKPTVDLSTLTINGEVISDAEQIHDELTEKFKEWYKIPEDLHNEAWKFRQQEYWSSLVQGTVKDHDEKQKVESFELSSFYEACKIKVTNTQRDEIAKMVLCPISETEYYNEIRKMAHGKAPGPTGATANMIKAWPKVLHDQVLSWLNNIWYDKRTPDWWNLAHLRPIPKPGEPSLENLRPLGLYEIIRKILTAIIIKRVYCQWEAMNLLNPNQHAFRRGLGTTNAIIRLMNVAEDAEERGSQLNVILWDFRRAFDSIDFNFTRPALTRLGMPIEAMEFLLHMMEENEMWVASPYHMTEHANTDIMECIGASFHQQRGTGQGDPPSPIIWIAVFDILLTMLDALGDEGQYYAHGLATEVYKVNDIAYADDLATISNTHEMQQAKADMVSTFCACTGMTIAAIKIRAFQINCMSPTRISIHNYAWEITWVEPQVDQLLVKYLGFILEHRNENSEAYEITVQYLREAIIHIARCHATPQIKMEVYRMQITPKIMYMAAKAAWNISSYRKLDALAARLLKVIGGQMTTSSNQMMFLPQDECGSGIQPPSDLAQTRKWAELVRVLNSKTESSLAANGLLERAIRQMSINAPPTHIRTLRQDNNRQFLKGSLNSLIMWGSEVGCFLSHTPIYEHTPSNTPILPFVSNQETRVLRDLQMCDLTVQGELTRRAHDGTVRWETSDMIRRIRSSISNNIIAHPSDEGIIMNCGQMYQVQGEYLEIIGKIHGSSPTKIRCYQWNRPTDKAKILVREISTQNTECTKEVVDFQNVRRVVTRINNTRSTSNMLVANIISNTICANPIEGVETMRELPIEILQFAEAIQRTMEVTCLQYSLYTDGSYKQKSLPWEAILRTKAVNRRVGKASAALIAIACSNDWKELPIHVLYLSESEQMFEIQSYEAELIALMTAIHVAIIIPDVEIFSDCQAAIATVIQSYSESSKKNTLVHVRPIVSILERLGRLPKIHWIRSHPEERMENSDQWQIHDWGSHIADEAAKGQLGQLVLQFKTATENVLAAPLDRVAMGMIPPGTWYWRREESYMPIMHSVIRFHSEHRSEKYFADRDADRICRGQDERWKGSSLALAARCWKKIASGVLGSNVALKNCLDKYYHGRNRAKGLVGIEAQRMSECHVCGQPDSQKHIILECNCEGLREIREEAYEQILDAAQTEIDKYGKKSRFIPRIVQFIVENAFKPQYHHYDRLWTGLWNTEVLQNGLSYRAQDGEIFPDTLPFEMINMIQDSIARITTPLVLALRNIMQTHRKASEDEIQEHSQRTEQRELGSCIKDGLQSGAQLCRQNTDIRIEDSLNEMGNATRKQSGAKEKSKRNSTNYGGKCTERRKLRSSRARKNGLDDICQKLSESCEIVVDSLVRKEGSVVESASHPSGATRFRDYDRD